MNEIPSEVLSLHCRLFERYVGALLERLERIHAVWEVPEERDERGLTEYYSNTPDYDEAQALMARIERLLSTESGQRSDYTFMTSQDFDALDQFRTIARDILGEPVAAEEYDESSVSQSDSEPEPESMVQELPPDEGREAGGDTPDGVADDPAVGLPDVRPSADLRASENGRKKRGGPRLCPECGHGFNSYYHRRTCKGLAFNPVPDNGAAATEEAEPIYDPAWVKERTEALRRLDESEIGDRRCAMGHQARPDTVRKDEAGHLICVRCRNPRCLDCGFTEDSISHQEHCLGKQMGAPVDPKVLEATWEQNPHLPKERVEELLRRRLITPARVSR